MSAIAIILARAGSKGLPGKNLAFVAGRPCAMWSIEHARRSRLAPRIAVSTDSLELQRLAMEAGVDVVARPAELASDTARVDDAVRHALACLDNAGACDPVVILYGNCPVRPPDLIDRAIARLLETDADSVQSYVSVGKFHPQWTCKVDESTGAVSPWEGDRLWAGAHRRQDLPGAFVPDGGIIVATRRALFLEVAGVDPESPHAFLGRDHRAVVNQPGDVVDIDSRLDLLVAEAILRERSAPSAGAPA